MRDCPPPVLLVRYSGYEEHMRSMIHKERLSVLWFSSGFGLDILPPSLKHRLDLIICISAWYLTWYRSCGLLEAVCSSLIRQGPCHIMCLGLKECVSVREHGLWSFAVCLDAVLD